MIRVASRKPHLCCGHVEEEERKSEREGNEREVRAAAGVASSLINDADSTFADGGVSDYARCNQPLYYITG